MKQHISILAIIFCLCSFTVNGQNSLSLTKLIELANAKTLSTFDTKVRELGYSFEKRNSDEKSTVSLYTKRIETTDKYYTFVLSYGDFSDGKPIVVFEASSNAAPTLLTNITKQAGEQGFQSSTDNCNSDSDNTSVFCYVRIDYRLYIFDTAIRDNEASYNRYKVKIFKR